MFFFSYLFLILLLLFGRNLWSHEKTRSIQDLHTEDIPRLGGIYLFLTFLVGIAVNNIPTKIFFINFILSFIPIFIFIGLEDLGKILNPLLRLTILFLSVTIFFLFSNFFLFPFIDLPYIGHLVNLYPLPFFIFCCLIAMNGSNFIDGLNGLSILTFLFQLLSILYLAFCLNDNLVFYDILSFVPFLIILLFFNFPKPFYFLGDLGAYLISAYISIYVIYFFGNHPNLKSSIAVLILFYPCYEVLFSFVRKILFKRSPFYPDNQHLHMLLFLLLKNKYNKNTKNANSLSTICLMPLISLSLIFTIISYQYNINPYYLIIISALFYNLIYFLLFFMGHNNDK